MATRISSACSVIGQVVYHATRFYMQLTFAGRVWRRRKGHKIFGVVVKISFSCKHSTIAQMDFEEDEQSQDQDRQQQQVDLVFIH